MELFFRAAGAVLIAVILCLTLQNLSKDMASMLTMAVCILVLSVGAVYLEPVIAFLEELEKLGNLNHEMISILLKAVCIGVLAEVAGMICSDAGIGSAGKALGILASVVILWLSLPILNALLELIGSILGEVT